MLPEGHKSHHPEGCPQPWSIFLLVVTMVALLGCLLGTCELEMPIYAVSAFQFSPYYLSIYIQIYFTSSSGFITFVLCEHPRVFCVSIRIEWNTRGPWRPCRSPVFSLSDEEAIIDVLPPDTPVWTRKLYSSARAFAQLVCRE